MVSAANLFAFGLGISHDGREESKDGDAWIVPEDHSHRTRKAIEEAIKEVDVPVYKPKAVDVKIGEDGNPVVRKETLD